MTGSQKRGICGGKNVRIMKDVAITIIRREEKRLLMSGFSGFSNFFVSMVYAIAAEAKNIPIFTASGDLPNAPL